MREQVGAGWATRYNLVGAAKEHLSKDAQVQGQMQESVPSKKCEPAQRSRLEQEVPYLQKPRLLL